MDHPTFLGLSLLAWIPLLPLLGALINLALGRWMSRSTVHTVAIASVVAAFGVSLWLLIWYLIPAFNAGQGGNGIEQSVYTWIEVGSFKVQLAFRMDTLSAVMVMIVTFIGSLIHIYSTGYMAHDPRYAAYFGYLNLFTGSMLILVLAANMPVMFIGWEGVGLCSFLLIGFWYENDAFATAGRKAFVVNRIGDFCFLLGMFLLFWAVKDVTLDPASAARGSLDFLNLKNPADAGAYVQSFWGGERLSAAAGILLFIGACGKSAQFPLYVWLPDAMAGPTPVSALIHAATMVTAGVYMVCRMSFLYASSTTAMIVVASVGLITALIAAFMAFAQTDLKKVLAYSTVSQLGFMFVAAGTGNWVAAIFHLATHAFFKAGLFLAAGSVMHGMEHGGSQTPGDITTMGGLRKHMKWTRACFFIYCLAIAGIVPFAGFFSKDEILGGAFSVTPPNWPAHFGQVLWVGLLIGALGTAFYMWRLYFMVFSGEERSEEAKHAHESPPSMTVPLVILAIGTCFVGWIGLPHLSFFEEHESLGKVFHTLARWLAPSVTATWHEGMPIANHESDTLTWLLMGIALAVAASGIGIAWLLYGRGPSPAVDRIIGPLHGDQATTTMGKLYVASKHKLWIDELYDSVFVKPFRLVARGLFEIVDRFVIDTVAVNGSAFVVGLFGRMSRWFQNGQVQRYLAGLVVGAAAVFFVTDCDRKPSFECHLVGDRVQLHAEPGAGIAGAGAKLHWDIDGDGKPDIDGKTGKLFEGADISVAVGDIGGQVEMWIDDPISRETVTVTRKVRIVSDTDVECE
ncbi:MAG TPA: NADH-quinone oxidoreductase subunit L [Kofleriaceae bacterium]|nr:NADH-quinone oxidoreductase subunit L [Kofleriaceae bacterium]